MKKRHIKIISAVVTLIIVLFYNLYDRLQLDRKSDDTGRVRIIGVTDGDTVNVILNGRKEKVRLIGIDAPELNQRPWGRKAKKYLEELMDASQWIVSLEFDVEERDKYGRLLCYLTTSDKRMINLQMIKDGYAMLYTIPPNVKHVEELRKAQNEARQQQIGIWGSKGLKESPSEYRKTHKF